MKRVIYFFTLLMIAVIMRSSKEFLFEKFSFEEKLAYVFASGQDFNYREPYGRLVHAGKFIQPNKVSPSDNLPYLTFGIFPLRFSTTKDMTNALKELKQEATLIKDSKGRTLLSIAVRSGDLEVVKYLVEQKGLPVDVQDAFGMTPLSWAVLSFATRPAEEKDMLVFIIQYLFQQGASVEKKSKMGWTPLHIACVVHAPTEVVGLLLSKKNMSGDVDSHGRTPLHLAALANKVKAAEKMVQEGALLTVQDYWGQTPYDLAISEEHQGLAQILKPAVAPAPIINQGAVAAWLSNMLQAFFPFSEKLQSDFADAEDDDEFKNWILDRQAKPGHEAVFDGIDPNNFAGGDAQAVRKVFLLFLADKVLKELGVRGFDAVNEYFGLTSRLLNAADYCIYLFQGNPITLSRDEASRIAEDRWVVEYWNDLAFMTSIPDIAGMANFFGFPATFSDYMNMVDGAILPFTASAQWLNGKIKGVDRQRIEKMLERRPYLPWKKSTVAKNLPIFEYDFLRTPADTLPIVMKLLEEDCTDLPFKELAYHALVSHNTKLMELLYSKGSITKEELSKAELLTAALDNDSVRLVEYLLSEAIVSKEELLLEAERQGQRVGFDVFKHLFQHVGLSTGQAKKLGEKALRRIVSSALDYIHQNKGKVEVPGFKEELDFLKEVGIDFNNQDSGKPTVLWEVVENCANDNVFPLAQELVTRGADPSQKDILGQTLAHIIVEKCQDVDGPNIPLMKLLVENGCPLDVKDYKGNTPVHLAAKFVSKEFLKFFKDQGADFLIKNNKGETPWDILRDGVSGAPALLVELQMQEGERPLYQLARALADLAQGQALESLADALKVLCSS